MKHAIKILTILDVIFILFLIASGSSSGIMSEVLYYSGFIIPVVIGYRISMKLKTRREEERGLSEPNERFFSLDKSSLVLVLPIALPTVALVFTVALLTSLLLASFGYASDSVQMRPLFEMILINAIAPAFFEEVLFRYIPMKLLMPYSKRWCIIFSSVYFALIHCSLFRLPYALTAGVIFIVVDMMAGSIWPSVILHLINNVLSIIWMKYCIDERSMLIFVLLIALCVLVSLAFVYIWRREYIKRIKGVFERGESFAVTYAPLALVIISMYIAMLSLLSN